MLDRQVRCPTLIIGCEKDVITPASAAIECARVIGDKAEYIEYEGMEHFDVYINEGFKRSSKEQLAFFQRTLLA